MPTKKTFDAVMRNSYDYSFVNDGAPVVVVFDEEIELTKPLTFVSSNLSSFRN